MPKVFVTQENHRLNYSDAERFGEVVFLTAREYSPNANSKRNEMIEEEIYEALSKFDPDEDSILLSGDPIIMALAFHQAADIPGRDRCEDLTISLLKWDNQTRRYNQVRVTV